MRQPDERPLDLGGGHELRFLSQSRSSRRRLSSHRSGIIRGHREPGKAGTVEFVSVGFLVAEQHSADHPPYAGEHQECCEHQNHAYGNKHNRSLWRHKALH